MPNFYSRFLLAITRRGKVIKIFREISSGWAQMVKNPPATQEEAQVRSLGQEDPLEKETATHSSILAWRIPSMEEPDRLRSMGGHKELDTTEQLTHTHTRAHTHTHTCTHQS